MYCMSVSLYVCLILGAINFTFVSSELSSQGHPRRPGGSQSGQESRRDESFQFKHRRKSPWVPTLTGPFPNGQANAGS